MATTTQTPRRPRPLPRRSTPDGSRRTPRSGFKAELDATALHPACALTVIVPLYFTVAMALKSSQQAARGTGFGWPWPMHFENFTTAWTLTNFPRAFSISFAHHGRHGRRSGRS